MPEKPDRQLCFNTPGSQPPEAPDSVSTQPLRACGKGELGALTHGWPVGLQKRGLSSVAGVEEKTLITDSEDTAQTQRLLGGLWACTLRESSALWDTGSGLPYWG